MNHFMIHFCFVYLAHLVERNTLLGTNISHPKTLLKMIFLFPMVGYVRFLEGMFTIIKLILQLNFTVHVAKYTLHAYYGHI